MAKRFIYDITLSVKDANTRIELYEFSVHQIAARCESIAFRHAKARAVDYIHRVWREELYNKLCLFSEVCLTAKQLKYLVNHGYIKHPNDKVVELKHTEVVAWID